VVKYKGQIDENCFFDFNNFLIINGSYEFTAVNYRLLPAAVTYR